MRPLRFLLLALAHCSSAPAATAGASTSDCVPLATTSGECPVNWDAAVADAPAFCAANGAMYSAFISDSACRGQLRYTRYLFDAGPRYCLYDPVTKQLTGFRASDPKASVDETTCGHARADFDDANCSGTRCGR